MLAQMHITTGNDILDRLVLEIRRQLLLCEQWHPNVPGMATVQILGDEYSTALKTLEQNITSLCHPRERAPFPNIAYDQSLLWKMPSLCTPYQYFLDVKCIKNDVKNICYVASNPNRVYTDDIWSHPLLSSWATTQKSCILYVHGDYDSITRVGLFGAELAEHIEQQQRIAYFLCTPTQEAGKGTPGLTAAQILKNVATQVLRTITQPLSVLMLAELVDDFSRASSCKDWFSILKKIFLETCNMYIVIDTGIWDFPDEQEVHDWPNELQSLLEKTQAQPRGVIIKVMIIDCHASRFSKYWGSSQAIVVGRPDIPPGYLYSLHQYRPTIPPSLIILPQALSVGEIDAAVVPVTNYVPTALDSTPAIKSALSSETTPSSDLFHPQQISNDRPKDREDFRVVIFCALRLEADAAILLFDEHWDLRQYGKASGDTNQYSLGAVGGHNVALVHLPSMGNNSAANAAPLCRMSFPKLNLALIVGVCGGVPSAVDSVERILGDVIISDGLVKYDLGRQFPGEFVRKSSLQDSYSRPNPEIRGFLAKLDGRRSRKMLLDEMRKYLGVLRTCDETLNETTYHHPGTDTDFLYQPLYLHKHRDSSQCSDWLEKCGKEGDVCKRARTQSCETLQCDKNRLVPRRRTQHQVGENAGSTDPMFHIGTFGSGDKVLKSGEERDRIAKDANIIAFEMEGAGVWDQLPTIIIKGICDYSDSHKNKKWQDYAAATAAACMKGILEQWQ